MCVKKNNTVFLRLDLPANSPKRSDHAEIRETAICMNLLAGHVLQLEVDPRFPLLAHIRQHQ